MNELIILSELHTIYSVWLKVWLEADQGKAARD